MFQIRENCNIPRITKRPSEIVRMQQKMPAAPWSLCGGVENGIVILRFSKEIDLQYLENDISTLPETPTIRRGSRGTLHKLFLPGRATEEFLHRRLNGRHAHVSKSAPLPGSVESITGEVHEWVTSSLAFAALPRDWIDALPKAPGVVKPPPGITATITDRAEWCPAGGWVDNENDW